MQGLLSPKVDFIFKKIFGDEQNPEVLLSLLNAILSFDTVLTTYKINSIEPLEGMRTMFSITATTDKGEIVNIEMQMMNEHDKNNRTLVHMMKTYMKSVEDSGFNFDKAERAICIDILYFNRTAAPGYHNMSRLADNQTREVLTDLLEMHTIELEKFKYDKNSTKNTKLDEWINFICNPQFYLDDQPFEEIETALNCLTKISEIEEVRKSYERREDILKQ